MKEINEIILEMKELARLNQVDVLYEKAKWLVALLEMKIDISEGSPDWWKKEAEKIYDSIKFTYGDKKA